MATPEQLVDDARSYASTIQTQATDAIRAVVNNIASTGVWSGYEPVWVDVETFKEVTLDEPPVLDSITLVLPTEPNTDVPLQSQIKSLSL